MSDSVAHDSINTMQNYKNPPHSRIITNFIDGSATWGDGTMIWHFAVILQQVRIGKNCMIGSRTEIGRGTTVGDYSRIGSGVFIPPNATIGHHVFIGPNVTFTDDKTPKVPDVGDPPYHAQPPIIEDFASIGAGAVILPGVRIGRGARVAAGATVTKDVVANGMVRNQDRARPRTMPEAWEDARALA